MVEEASRAKGAASPDAERVSVLKQVTRRYVRISMVATLFAGLGVASSLVLTFTESIGRNDPLAEFLLPENRRFERQLTSQNSQIEEIRSQLAKAWLNAPVPNGVAPSSRELVALTKRIDALEAEQKRLNDIISTSPEKAIAIPLMRREIDDVRGSQTQVADALKREIDRIYDLNKWIIGGLSVGVLGLLVRDIFRGRGNLGG